MLFIVLLPTSVKYQMKLKLPLIAATIVLASSLIACKDSGSSSNNTNENSSAVSVTEIVSNANLSFELQFMGSLYLSNNKTETWTQERQQPYIDASNQWLLSLRGIEGQTAHHTIKIKVRVKTLRNGNGMAGPDSDFVLGDKAYPATGEMVIGNHTYVTGFDPVEFKANILHELGHIIGIGSYTIPYVSVDANYKGNVFKVPNSKAAEEYNRIYSTNYDFVPFSDGGGHLYDNLLQEDKKRILDDGTVLPPLTKEVMANGVKFGRVTLGVLDDIGYVVDYNNSEIYAP